MTLEEQMYLTMRQIEAMQDAQTNAMTYLSGMLYVSSGQDLKKITQRIRLSIRNKLS